jgi:hypothetical protein
MNKHRVYISLFSMATEKKSYVRLFFKVLLLAVYFAFFSVQLFLRYASSHSQQSLNLVCYQKNVVAKQTLEKIFLSQKGNKKNKNHSYLNKRFHPQDEVVFPSHYIPFRTFYTVVVGFFHATDEHFTDAEINSASLRGPPALA